MKNKGLALSFIIILLTNVGFAQDALEKFGKNRVQYKTFDWRYYSTENFDIYFYDNGEWLSKNAAKFLEDEFEKITDILGYAPYTKTKIFLYNSPSDLHQSNVGIDESDFDPGGQTDFVQSHVEIAYPGTLEGFKDELILQISEMLIYDMMFGGSLTDMFQNAYLLTLPDWFMNGAAKYIAEGWSVAMDDFTRDLMKDQKVKKLNKYTGEEATLLGHSIWNFIAERYGKSNISNILNLTRIIRNEEKSIANTLGMSFRQFLFEWQNFYSNMSKQINNDYKYPETEYQIRKKNKKNLDYNHIKINDEGTLMAYSENNDGKFKVKIVNLTNGKEKTVLSEGYKMISQEFNQDLPLLAWRDNYNLAAIFSKSGKIFLWDYNISSKNKLRKELGRLNNIKSFDIAEGGNLAVVSADVNGINDLFLISLRRNSIKRITNDIFDDVEPKFVPNTSSIVFSSNRTTDSLQFENESFEKVNDNYNLFVYSIDTTRDVLSRLTNTLSRDTKPVPVNENDIYYLSDQKGIFNLYRYEIDKNIYTQISNYALSIQDYDVNIEQDYFAFIMEDHENENAYLIPQYNFDQSYFPPQTRRKEINNAKFISQRLKNRKQNTDANTSVGEVQQTPDSLNNETEKQEQGIIDTDNYVFDEEVLKTTETRKSFLTNYRQIQRESKILGPLPYQPRFRADNITTSFIIDPLIGFGIQLETEMNDLLENHKFNGGIIFTTDLKNGSLFGEYQYLQNRIDYGMKYERKIYNLPSVEGASHKYVLNRFNTTASLPISNSSRISVSPFYANTQFYDLDSRIIQNAPLPAPPGVPEPTSQSSNHFGGLELNYVFDNTIANDLNITQGTRAKLTYSHFEAFNDSRKSFSKIQLDLRNYQKVVRELIFATRLFYGRFMGPNKQNYLLGGMDNWLFNKTNSTGDNDPLLNRTYVDNSNILFVEYVTSLRGFDYNTFNGANALLFNAELRFPVIRFFYRGPISSNFFRNLQFVGFYDIGSAWTGNSPFATENNVNTELIKNQGSPFEIRLKNYKNPWLSSYGFGVRTVLLGYYIKFDMAYPIEDYVVKDQRFYFTLGYDF